MSSGALPGCTAFVWPDFSQQVRCAICASGPRRSTCFSQKAQVGPVCLSSHLARANPARTPARNVSRNAMTVKPRFVNFTIAPPAPKGNLDCARKLPTRKLLPSAAVGSPLPSRPRRPAPTVPPRLCRLLDDSLLVKHTDLHPCLSRLSPSPNQYNTEPSSAWNSAPHSWQ